MSTYITYDSQHPLVLKVNAFEEQWPGSDYSPAHIFIADYNFLDHNIEFCRDLIAKELSGETRNYPERSRTELEATDAFLASFLSIPEDERDIFYEYDPDGAK